MFYFTPEGWKAFSNKITYKETKEVYENEIESYTQNENFTEVNVTPVILTEEQLKRLDLIKKISSMGARDVEKYVIDNIIENSELVEFNEVIKKNRLLSLIKWDELSEEEKKEFESYL